VKNEADFGCRGSSTWKSIIRAVFGAIGIVAAFFRDRQLISAGEDKANSKMSAAQLLRVRRANRARLDPADGVLKTDFRD
jgi:hypothetical protein